MGANDDRDNTPPDLDGMRAFIARGDRERPDVFVGRDDVVAALGETLEVLEREATLRGAPRIVQGAPGAGKTALMHELHARWQERSAAGQPPLVLTVPTDGFASRDVLVALVAEAMGIGQLELPVHTKATEVRGGVKIPGVEGQRGRISTRHYTGAPITFETLRRHCPPDWRRPVVLLVDEAQQLPPDGVRIDEHGKEHPLNTSVAELHRGEHGLPILPVYFGLSSTRGVLSILGASRVAAGATYNLAGISADEALKVGLETLAKYSPGGSAEDLERWARACAEQAYGWPQHLNNNISACFTVLLDSAGDLGRASLDAAMDIADRMRRKYYDERVAAIGRYGEAGLAAVRHAARMGGATERVLLAVLREELVGRDGVEPGDAARVASDLFERLLEAGALSPIGGTPTDYDCPIPSFVNYILRQDDPLPGGAGHSSAASPTP